MPLRHVLASPEPMTRGGPVTAPATVGAPGQIVEVPDREGDAARLPPCSEGP